MESRYVELYVSSSAMYLIRREELGTVNKSDSSQYSGCCMWAKKNERKFSAERWGVQAKANTSLLCKLLVSRNYVDPSSP